MIYLYVYNVYNVYNTIYYTCIHNTFTYIVLMTIKYIHNNLISEH